MIEENVFRFQHNFFENVEHYKMTVFVVLYGIAVVSFEKESRKTIDEHECWRCIFCFVDNLNDIDENGDGSVIRTINTSTWGKNSFREHTKV